MPLTIIIAGIFSIPLLASAATAAPAAVTIDSTKPTLADKDGGGWTTALGFTNLTKGKLILSVSPAAVTDAGCMPKVDSGDLAPSTHTDVSVTLNPGCTVADNGITLLAAVSSPGSTSPAEVFTVSAAPKPRNGIVWDPLRAFPIAFVSLLAAGLIFFVIWDATDDQDHRISEQLRYLEATWSFKDSWVSNITVGAALLTGVFGSTDVVAPLLGTDGKDAVALATVGAAVAAAFVGAGPILLAACKKGGVVTVGGLFAASALTLTGAAGEIYTVYASARLLDLGGWEDRIYILAIIAAALLAVYAVRTLHEVLEQGTTPPPSVAPSDAIVAAKMVVAALQAKADIAEERVTAALELIAETYPQINAEPNYSYVPPRRAALL